MNSSTTGSALPTRWISGYQARGEGVVPRTYFARYTLANLAERDLLDRHAINGFLLDSGLKDYTWDMIWAEDYPTPDEQLIARFTDVDGYVLFMHGVTASRAIWEELPGMVVRQNRRLVALAVDHNGFGGTPFVTSLPALEQCSPVALMHADEAWFELLGLRRQAGERTPKTINFVGHSMGGAALFFLDEARWRYGEQTRLALAPALLLRDELHKAFFNTLGLGLNLVERLRFLENVENVVSHPTVLQLVDGATDAVRAEHLRIYDTTPKGVSARTITAMGMLHERPPAHDWELMRVIVAHRDRLVGLVPMMELLQELNFTVDQVRAVMGTHYLFSLGAETHHVHQQNRALVLADILGLHEQALARQKGS